MGWRKYTCAISAAIVVLHLVTPCRAWSCATGPGYCSVEHDGTIDISVDDHNIGAVSSDELFQFGAFSVQLKLPATNSKGTVIAFYLMDNTTASNKDINHNEIDVEIYGADNPQDVMYTTNVYAGGKQNLAQYHLPFNPSDHFHTYSIQWNQAFIVWAVDGRPFRVLRRDSGDPWPDRPMQLSISYWDCSAYCGAHDFSQGPVTVQARRLFAKGCAATNENQPPPPGSCATIRRLGRFTPWNRHLTRPEVMAWAYNRDNYKIQSWGWDTA